MVKKLMVSKYALREFITVYRLYRCHHSFGYALRRAWHIAVQGSPF